MTEKMNVSVIGLGSIGWGAACSLVREGFKTYGLVRRDEMVEKFNAERGIATKDPKIAVENSDVVFIYVINIKQVRDVLFGDNGCVQWAKKGTVFVIGSTVSPEHMRDLAHQLEQAGMDVMDAPVSGGAPRAIKGDLTLMASATPAVFEKIDAPLQAIAGKVFNLGSKAGAGQSMKLVHQVLALVHIATMGEAMAMAQRMDLDLSTVYDVVMVSAGYSWMFENRGAHVRDADYTTWSAVDTVVKDLNIITQEAKNLDFNLELSETAFTLFKEAQAEGYGQQDDASIAKWIARKNGIRMHGDTE